MTDVLSSPAFGQADLTNCERELIHLAGSIQPHGLLLVVREPSLEIAKASVNAGTLLRLPSNDLIGRRLDSFGGDLAAEVRRFIEADGLDETQPMRCTVAGVAGPIDFEGSVHRCGEGLLVVELEPLSDADSGREVRGRALRARLASAIEDCSGATSIVGLADTVVRALREIVGYDRVMVYKFDPDGHGEIIAEARDEALDSLLGHHYPATDIPQRARALYLRNRVRLLVDVHYDAVPIEPAGRELDMSLCQLRSMSPLHLQYLKNMGVTATLVVSLVREGRLWGLIACHHYRPRRVGYSVRAACALLAEVISTRITAIENYSHAQGVILLRSLEQRLIDATSTDGDWRRALFQHPHALLQPMNATGAALFFEGEIMTSGEVPSTPELRKLLLAVASRAFGGTFSTASISREHPDLASINATASGVVAVALSTSRPDYLMWFRGEQVSEVTWAGDPAKAVIDNDPLNLSPRRSFAAWSQIVRGSASPWSSAELSLAQAIGATLIDIILQIQAVRLLIAQHQFALVEVTVQNSKEPVVIADGAGRIILKNEAFSQRLWGEAIATLDDLGGAFTDAEQARAMLKTLRAERRAWRGELEIADRDGAVTAVGVRADTVIGTYGLLLGFILIFDDLTESKRADLARIHLQDALFRVARIESAEAGMGADSDPPDGVIGAILANARLAALDISDGRSGESVAPLIEELRTATQRATALYAQLREHGFDGAGADDSGRDPA